MQMNSIWSLAVSPVPRPVGRFHRRRKLGDGQQLVKQPVDTKRSRCLAAILGSYAALTPATITLDGAQTLGSLTFNNSTGYTLMAGSLTLDNTGGTGNAQIVVLSGTHSIAASLTLAGTNTADFGYQRQ